MNTSNHMKQTIALLLLTNISCFATSNFITLKTEKEFDEKVLKNDKPSVVKFAADWCGVCKGVKKPFEEVAHEDEFKHIQFVHINVDNAKDLSDKYQVNGVPHFLYFDHGKKVFEETGVKNMDKFKDHMRESLHKYFPKEGQTKMDAQVKPEPTHDADTATPKEQENAESFLDTIGSIFKQIIDLIVSVIKYAVDAVRGLFKA